jgi:hypothetical protein
VSLRQRQEVQTVLQDEDDGIDRRSRVLLFVLASIVAVAILFGIASVARNGDSSGGGPRRVWSPEHGHYHTVQ